MGRLRPRAPDALLALLLMALTGCGGGSSSIQPPPPPPPQPDFSLGFSQNSVSVQQGSTSSTINLSVNPLNGFAGSVQVTVTGLPVGVLSNPRAQSASPLARACPFSSPPLLTPQQETPR